MDAFERASQEMAKNFHPEDKYFVCWLCGKYNETTCHHAIPKSLNPKFNKVVKICRECHNKVNKFYIETQAGHFEKKIKGLENHIEHYKKLYQKYKKKCEGLYKYTLDLECLIDHFEIKNDEKPCKKE